MYIIYIYIICIHLQYSCPPITSKHHNTTKDQRFQVDRLQPELCNLFLQQPLLQPFFAMQNVQLEVLILTEMLQPLNSACLSNRPNPMVQQEINALSNFRLDYFRCQK